jgi:hypothetical protein
VTGGNLVRVAGGEVHARAVGHLDVESARE